MPAQPATSESRPPAAPTEPSPAPSAWSDRELRRRRIIAHYRRFGGSGLVRVVGPMALTASRARPAVSVQP